MRRRILLHRTLGGLLLLFLLLTVPALANESGVARTEFAPEPNVKRLALVIGTRTMSPTPCAIRPMTAFFNQRAPYWLEPHTGMRFVEIPGGSFEIGDQFDERGDNEKTGWFDELNPRGISTSSPSRWGQLK